MSLHFNSSPLSFELVEGTKDKWSGETVIKVEVKDNGESIFLAVNGVLMATGRRPNVKDMGLEEAGIEFDEVKGVIVNDNLKTTNGSVYAVGDCASRF